MNLKKNTLILLRHSKAESGLLINDFDRELLPSGRKKALDFARLLKENSITPDFCLSSKAKRAYQTSQCVSQYFNDSFEIKTSKSLYYADDEVMLSKIQSKLKGHCVLLVAHAPTISSVAYHLQSKKLFLGDFSTAQGLILTSDLPYKKWSFDEIEPVLLLKGSE